MPEVLSPREDGVKLCNQLSGGFLFVDPQAFEDRQEVHRGYVCERLVADDRIDVEVQPLPPLKSGVLRSEPSVTLLFSQDGGAGIPDRDGARLRDLDLDLRRVFAGPDSDSQLFGKLPRLPQRHRRPTAQPTIPTPYPDRP